MKYIWYSPKKSKYPLFTSQKGTNTYHVYSICIDSVWNQISRVLFIHFIEKGSYSFEFWSWYAKVTGLSVLSFMINNGIGAFVSPHCPHSKHTALKHRHINVDAMSHRRRHDVVLRHVPAWLVTGKLHTRHVCLCWCPVTLFHNATTSY